MGIQVAGEPTALPGTRVVLKAESQQKKPHPSSYAVRQVGHDAQAVDMECRILPSEISYGRKDEIRPF